MNNDEKNNQSLETNPKITQMIELVDKTVKTALTRDFQLQPSEEVSISAPVHPQSFSWARTGCEDQQQACHCGKGLI